MFAWNPFEGGSSCSHTQHREGREIYWISTRAASIYSQSIAPRLKIRKCQKILLKVEKLTNPRVLLSVPNLWSESERSQQCVGVFKHLFNCWHCRGDIQLHKRWDMVGQRTAMTSQKTIQTHIWVRFCRFCPILWFDHWYLHFERQP